MSDAEGDDPYAPAVAQGIHRISVPTPFAVGRVNTFLIEDDPLTLVDTGPNSGTSFDELQHGIEALGHELADIELVVITHQHLDHLGLVSLVAGHSGAEVAAIEGAARFLTNYEAEAKAEDDYAGDLMLGNGIPADVASALQSVSGAFHAWGARADVNRVLHDGDLLTFAHRTLEVQLRPGHSPSDTLFVDRDRRLLLGGDHLLKHISSNPLVARPPDESDKRPQSLVMYLDSLHRTRELELDLVLPGHGDPIDDHRALIDQRFVSHDRRAAKIHRLISERPRSAYEIAQALWGNIAVTQAYLTLSEVLGHMDLLLNAGQARERDEDGVSVFEAVE
jgi:glyoxylase-like metal-dependent hydrolase (beta-lactamase superfamily II)